MSLCKKIQHLRPSVKQNPRIPASILQGIRHLRKFPMTGPQLCGIMYVQHDLEVTAMPANRPRTKAHKLQKNIRNALLTLLLLATTASTLHSGQTQVVAEGETTMPTRQARNVMYLMDEHGIKLRDADARQLDQINYSFALIKDGRADGSHWVSVDKVTAFLKRHPHIDGVLSVGGWGADGFSDAVATEEGRKTLADSILSLMDRHGFVGVDIDWEYPGVPGTGIKSQPEDVANWYELLALLREGLDARTAKTGRKHLLSVALGVSKSCLSVLEPARLDALLDQVVIMAYDLSGFERITGHHAGLYPDENRAETGAWAVQTLAEGGLSREKMLLGVPAYGRVWRQVSTRSGNGLGQRAATSGNKTIDFDAVLRLEDDGYTRHYDERAQAAWWFNGTNFVSAEDDRSLAYKCAWVLEQGLQGVAVWQYTQDDSGAMLAMLGAALAGE